MTLSKLERAGFGNSAMAAGSVDFAKEDPETNAVDTIANILHALPEGTDTDSVLRRATMHFEAEKDEP
jgi:hypothetical protein